MLFALDYLNQMEAKYPGVLDQITTEPDMAACIRAMKRLGVAFHDCSLLLALRTWRPKMATVTLDPGILELVMNLTLLPSQPIPIPVLKQLSSPCFAISTCPIELKDWANDQVVITYTGNAFIWIEDSKLFSAWEIEDSTIEPFYLAILDLSKPTTLDECFDDYIKNELCAAGFDESDIPVIRKILGVNQFHNLTRVSRDHYSALSCCYGNKGTSIIKGIIEAGTRREQLLQKSIHIVSYLVSSNRRD